MSELETEKQICDRLGMSRTSLWRLRKEGDFPSPVKLGKRAVAYHRKEVDEWLANRPRAILS